MKEPVKTQNNAPLAVILQRCVMWYDRHRKIIFLKSNGWERCGDKWKYKSILSPIKLRTLDEAVKYEKFMS